MPKDRLLVVDRSSYVSLYDLLDNLDFDDVIAELTKLKSTINYGSGENAKFKIEPYGYDGGVDCVLVVHRLETDKEYDARQLKEEKAKEKARLAREKKKETARKVLAETEESERAEYERLKVKFG